MIKVKKVFDIFSSFSGLETNKSKTEVTEINTLKEFNLELCGVKHIDLRLNTVKVLGIHFSYNTKFENNENFLKFITSIEKILKVWRMQKLTV